MTMFDDIARDDVEPPPQDEGAFAYLNRSGRREAGKVRGVIDDWLAHYPAEHRDSMVARLRSALDDQHKAAFFELFLYQLLLARGLKVVSVEPPVGQTKKVPDFLVETPEGERFYLEAVVATGRSTKETAARARLNQALAGIDATPSPKH